MRFFLKVEPKNYKENKHNKNNKENKSSYIDNNTNSTNNNNNTNNNKIIFCNSSRSSNHIIIMIKITIT